MARPRSAPDPDLQRRGRLVRSLGALRDMLPGSFVERQRRCGQPNCRCADGQSLHTQFQLSVLIQGQPQAFHVPARLAAVVRQHVELRQRFEAAAAAICQINLRRCLQQRRQG
ncbi:MAG TPA: DUF6788 family protein [Terriglobales bacterium]|nr:DUF6788 family protein [Terriglobales bacterium]